MLVAMKPHGQSSPGCHATPAFAGAGSTSFLYNFKPGAISRALIDDYSAEMRPKQKAA